MYSLGQLISYDILSGNHGEVSAEEIELLREDCKMNACEIHLLKSLGNKQKYYNLK